MARPGQGGQRAELLQNSCVYTAASGNAIAPTTLSGRVSHVQLGEAQVHNFIIIIFFIIFYKETPKKAVEGSWLPPPKSLIREAWTIRC